MANQLVQEGNALYVLDQECLRQKAMQKEGAGQEEKDGGSFGRRGIWHLGLDMTSSRRDNRCHKMMVLLYYMYFIQNMRN